MVSHAGPQIGHDRVGLLAAVRSGPRRDGTLNRPTIGVPDQAMNGTGPIGSSPVSVADQVTRHRVMIATELVEDIARLDTLLKASKKRVEQAVVASGTTLTEIVGIGPICAAIIIGYTGDIGRFPTKGHFATYNTTAPVDTSWATPKASTEPARQPQTQPRHPHRGDRTAPFRHRGPTPTTNANSPRANHSKDAIRALKRRISDRVYRHLNIDTQRSATS